MSDSDDAGDTEADDPDAERRDASEVDPTEHEPDEYDPEADLADPERELVSVPEPPAVPPESEAPKELREAFWKLVIVFNVALLSFSLGAMLLVFERLWLVGGALVAVGLLSFLRGYTRYERVTGDDSLWRPADDSE